LLQPESKWNPFYSGKEAVIDQDRCTGCGLCYRECRFEAIEKQEREKSRPRYQVSLTGCEGCGVCVRFCPVGAIRFEETLCGEWSVADTRMGPLVHARLGVGAENSGKLVSLVRSEAQKVARERGIERILVDGPPGTGCPVIASLTGAERVLIVTEPTVSGEHDLKRVLELTRHFGIPALVSVNKWDINPDLTERIERISQEAGARVAGRIRYDKAVTQAQRLGKTVVETEALAAQDIRKIWETLNQ
jgi:MinD superfamily P-loop ATPase